MIILLSPYFRQIEGRVVEISQLQEFFADKVLEQVDIYYLIQLNKHLTKFIQLRIVKLHN